MRPVRLASFALASLAASVASLAGCFGDEPSMVPSGEGPAGEDGGAGALDGSLDDAAGQADSASGDGGGDAARPPLDVRTLPGLRLWLESTQALTKAALGNDLVSWGDSSGRWADGGAGAPDGGAHAAVPVPFEGGGAINPSVTANGIAGRPSVGFDTGLRLAVANHEDFTVGTGDFVVAVVASVSSGSGAFWNLMLAASSARGTWLGATKACWYRNGFGDPTTCTSPDYSPSTSPHVFVARRKAAQLVFRVDGTSRGTYDFGVDNPNLGVAPFQQPSALIGGGIKAQLSELALVVGPTTDADLEALEAHLRAKYAIP